jgi:L-amino acid N-acyltransferase YncA
MLSCLSGIRVRISASMIRPATPADVPAMALLWHEKMTIQQQTDRRVQLAPNAQEEWSQAMCGWLEDSCYAVYVAERGGTLVGYAVGRIQDNPPGLRPARIGTVIEMAVGAHSYQSGLGKELLKPLRLWFSAQGITSIVAYVPRRQPVEQAFWRALGATELTDVMWMKL